MSSRGFKKEVVGPRRTGGPGLGRVKVKGEDLAWMWTSPEPETSMQPEWIVYCLCDGHGGPDAAKFLRNNLTNHLGLELPQWKPSSWTSHEVADFAFEICEAVCRSIQALETTWEPMGNSAGSTITLAIICEQFMTIANVGDSHAFLDCDTTLIEVTHSHRLEDNAYEVDRLSQHGDMLARLTFDPRGGPAAPGTTGVGGLRVWPSGLSVGRSFGDHDAPTSVTARPHFKQMVLPGAGCRLIIASDGVWDVLNPDFVWNLTKRVSTEEAARLVIERLLTRTYGNPQDDATVLVIDFEAFDACLIKQNQNQQECLLPSFFCELDSLDIFPDPRITDPKSTKSSDLTLSSNCLQACSTGEASPRSVMAY